MFMTIMEWGSENVDFYCRAHDSYLKKNIVALKSMVRDHELVSTTCGI